MNKHEHERLEFYSDAFDDPIFVSCADCGQVLDVSAAMLDSLYAEKINEKDKSSAP